MSSVIQTAIRAALSTMATAVGGAVVSYGGRTATGVPLPKRVGVEFGQGGDAGDVTGGVRVSMAFLPVPSFGDEITIDGTRVYVAEVTQDEAGATMLIRYTESEPYQGGAT
jgi:hypothetical protein